jgi:hypothetical protein
MTDLWQAFLTHNGRIAHKWTHYFPAYEAHFARFKNRPTIFWEIGIGEGGSLQLWKGYLGPFARIVGLDIRDRRALEDDQISIRTGDQSDTTFLQSVIDEFGPPDVVLDDGSHVMEHVAETFRYLYPRMSPAGVYMVEDLHTAYWPEYSGGLHDSRSFVEITKSLIDELNADHTRGALAPTDFTNSTLSIHFYDSIIAFERGSHQVKHAPRIGHVSQQRRIRRSINRVRAHGT